MIKRSLSALIGVPLVVIILVFGNTQIVDAVVSLITLIALHEFFNAFDSLKNIIILKLIAYFYAMLIAFIHIIPIEYIFIITIAMFPITLITLFLCVIVSNMKYTIKDIAIVLFGICYIVFNIVFLSIIRNMENGKVLIWIVFMAAWGTDIFAYLIGRKFGKHKFSKISPNKSIEGCIAGVLGSVICMLIYALICNKFLNVEFNYIFISSIAVILSIVGQIGDLAASSIKRYADIKDFSNIIPGHGGILDRIDSILFIAPITYLFLLLIH